MSIQDRYNFMVAVLFRKLNLTRSFSPETHREILPTDSAFFRIGSMIWPMSEPRSPTYFLQIFPDTRLFIFWKHLDGLEIMLTRECFLSRPRISICEMIHGPA